MSRKKCVHEVFNISRVKFNKVSVQWVIISMISVFAPQCSQKDDLYDSVVNALKKMREKEILVIAEDLNGHVESNSENYDDQHGDKKERRNES